MVLFNATTKELTAKIVYYGPGLCGKTTNLQFIYDSLPHDGRGKMLSLATQTDRTLFFDFLPIEIGTIRGMKTRIQLYTVPGQVFYDATRKLVLRGADGVVFVADSQAHALDSNKESFQNLIENLREQGVELEHIPHVIQWNKRDTPTALPVDLLEREVNLFKAPTFESSAVQGEGVRDTLTGIARLVLKQLTEKYGGEPSEQDLSLPSAPPNAATKAPAHPLEVEELSTQEMLEETEEIEDLSDAETQPPHHSVVEVPVVLDRSLFTGDGPVEIKLKLYLK